MPFAAAFRSLVSALEMLVLSWTSHARLARALEPADYDLILKRTIREVKFYSETLLAILFFMGASVTNPPLISWTLACLLYTLIAYISLEAMSGEALHKWIDEIPCGRVFLACLTKLPALSVLSTLCALALTRWNSVFTILVMATTSATLVFLLALRMKLHAAVVRFWGRLSYIIKTARSAGRQAGHLEQRSVGEKEADEWNETVELPTRPECV